MKEKGVCKKSRTSGWSLRKSQKKSMRQSLGKILCSAGVGFLVLNMSSSLIYAAEHHVGIDKYNTVAELITDGVLQDGDTIILHGNDASLREQKVLSFTQLTVKSSGSMVVLTQVPNPGGVPSPHYGGVFRFDSNDIKLNLENVTIANSTVQQDRISGAQQGRGGAIYVGTPTNHYIQRKLDMSGSSNISFQNNSALGPENGVSVFSMTAKGGAIYVSGALDFSNTKNVSFIGNKAIGGTIDPSANIILPALYDINNAHGGAIYGTTLNFQNAQNVVFADNQAIGRDSVYHSDGKPILRQYNGLGGALGVDNGGMLDMQGAKNVLFINNLAKGGATNDWHVNATGTLSAVKSGLGGAIFSWRSKLIIEGATFLYNKATTASDNDLSSGLGGAIYSIGSDITLRTTEGRDILFSGNTHNPGNTGEVPNSIYFGKFQPGADENTQLLVENEVNSAVYMYDSLASEKDVLGINGGKVNLTIDKKGLGDWVLGGYNDMKSSTTWTISEGTLHFDVVNGTPTYLDLSHDTTATFTLESGAHLLLNPYTSPHFITAKEITFANGSTVGVDYNGSFTYMNVGEGASSPILSLRTDNNNNYLPTPIINARKIEDAGGFITSGMYDYTYDLEWRINSAFSHDLLARVRSKTYNRETGASSATTAPGAIAKQNLIGKLVRKRLLQNFEFLNECEKAKSGSGQVDFSDNHQKKAQKFWGTQFYNYTSSNTDSDYNIKTPGLALGLENRAEDKYFIGGAVLGAFPEYNSTHAKIDGKNVNAIIYGGFKTPSKLEISWLTSYGYNWYDQRRRVQSSFYNSDYKGHDWTFGVGVGKSYKVNEKTVLRPFVEYEFMNLKVGAFRESTGTHALSYASRSNSFHFLRAGLDLKWLNSRSAVHSSIYYAGFYGDVNATANATFVLDRNATQYISYGDKLDRHALGLSVDGTFCLSTGWQLETNYTFEKGKSIKNHYGSVNLIYKF